MAQLRLCENHAAEAFSMLVQKAYPGLFSCLLALSFGIEIERLRSLKSNLAFGARRLLDAMALREAAPGHHHS